MYFGWFSGLKMLFINIAVKKGTRKTNGFLTCVTPQLEHSTPSFGISLKI